MSVWNKYGTISRDGKIDARFYTTELEYEAVYNLWNAEPVGNKYDFRVTVDLHNSRITALHNGKPLGYLPIDWTKFVHEVATRGPLSGTAGLQWMEDREHFRLRVDIDESITS